MDLPSTALRHRAFLELRGGLPRAAAADVERACYCAAVSNGAAYRRLVLSALHGVERGALAALVTTDGAAAALTAPPQEIYGAWPALEEARAQDAAAERGRAMLQELAGGDDEGAPDAGLRCQRCGSSDISVALMQTRSADEGTTIYCTCSGCHKRWKM